MKIPVLDHGFVELVESWGSEERIIEAARMSTDKGFLGWGPRCKKCGLGPEVHPNGHCDELPGLSTEFAPGDEKLLRYLWEHKHGTPFEMAGLTIEVQAPIFVFREWHRHRTQSYNELSARYTPMPDVNYIPTIERIMMSGGSNKQAQGAKVVHQNEAETFIRDLERHYVDAEAQYQSALLAGVPKELARLCIPVGRYSRMRASTDLRNWLGFLMLRMDKTAQWEIRQYANIVGDIIATLFPRTWALFNKA